ncbi:hypothetical protein RYX36_006357 [Vicia faba]
MGCGKSKHDVASGNTTVLRCEKSCVSCKKKVIETNNTNNNNIHNVRLFVEIEHKESESVKENDDEDNKYKEYFDGEDKKIINDEANKEGNVRNEEKIIIEENKKSVHDKLGCGKYKHDVASGNTTVLQHEKSCVCFKENVTETNNTNNNNIDNVRSFVEIEHKESESVKENDNEDNKDKEYFDVEDKKNNK